MSLYRIWGTGAKHQKIPVQEGIDSPVEPVGRTQIYSEDKDTRDCEFIEGQLMSSGGRGY